MWRFLMPAVVMVGALVVLLAGALGDGKSLPNLSTEVPALIASVLPSRTAVPTTDGTPAAPSPSVSPAAPHSRVPLCRYSSRQRRNWSDRWPSYRRRLRSVRRNLVSSVPTRMQRTTSWTHCSSSGRMTEAAVARLQSQQQQLAAAAPPAAETSAVAPQQQGTNDALQRQATELQAQIKRRSQELASLSASEEQAHHELDALHQKRQADEAAVAGLQSQQPQSAAVEPSNPTTRSRPEQQTSQAKPAPAPTTAMQATLAELRAKERAPQRPQQQPTQPAPVPSQTASTQPVLIVSTRGVLVTARELLASGRAADARQLLMKAQAESTLRPVTPDQPLATGRSAAAIQINDAIRLLDAGKTGSALQAINLAMDSTRDSPGGWPAYPQEPRSYGYSAAPPNYDGNVRQLTDCWAPRKGAIRAEGRGLRKPVKHSYIARYQCRGR